MPKGDREKLKADPEDGTTPIANLLLEALAIAKLTGKEKGVILYLWRRTYGWERDGRRLKEKAISLSEFGKVCNLDTAAASKLLSGLVDKNILKRNFAGPGKGYTYSMNTRVGEWDKGCINQQLLRELSIQPLVKTTTQPLVKTTTPSNTKSASLNKRKEILNKEKGELLSPKQKELFTILLRCPAIKESDACKLPELLADYPNVNHALEFKKFVEWWPGPKKRKNPWLTLRNWLQGAQREAIESPGGKTYDRAAENRQRPKFDVEIIKSGEDENEPRDTPRGASV